jgi:hypothetical protein
MWREPDQYGEMRKDLAREINTPASAGVFVFLNPAGYTVLAV